MPSLGLFGFLIFVIFHKGRIYLQGVELCVCVCVCVEGGGVIFVFGSVSGLWQSHVCAVFHRSFEK